MIADRKIQKTATLHFAEGGSDKIYTATVMRSDDGFTLEIDYGRRGGTMKHETKITNGDEATVEKAFTKLVGEKIKKGYSAVSGDETALVATTDRDGKSSGHRPQLLRQITADELEELLAVPGIIVQPKMDGERRMLVNENDQIYGSNRKGMVVPLPQNIADAAAKMPTNIVLDDEIIGQTLHAFDVLCVDGEDIKHLGFEQRYQHLAGLNLDGKDIKIVPCYRGRDIEDAIREMQQNGQEGIVIRRASDTYTPGKNNKYGTTPAKYKFYNTASVVVSSHNDKHSVETCVINSGQMTDIGSVTIPPSQPLPPIGAVVEVRYLYAYRGGSLYQPTYLGERNDISVDECSIDQLVYKS